MEIKKRASVKGVINCWEKGGILGVKIYLNESEIFENTWVSKIKNLLDKGFTKSVNEEIELVAFNIDLKNKIYTFNIDLKNKIYTKKEKDEHKKTT